MKNRWTLRKGLRRGERERTKERESCKIFAKKNNPGTLSNYIYLSCVVLLGRPCGLPWLLHGSFFTLSDPGWRVKKRVGFRAVGWWVGVLGLSGRVVLRWGGWPQGVKCGKGLWGPGGFTSLTASLSSPRIMIRITALI